MKPKDVRDNLGRFLPGTAGGPGRVRLPDWFSSKLPDLLDIQLRAVFDGRIPVAPPRQGEAPSIEEMLESGDAMLVETQIVPPSERLQLAGRLADRIVGKAPIAVEVGPVGSVNAALAELLKLKVQPGDDAKQVVDVVDAEVKK